MPSSACKKRPRSEEHTSELQSPCNLACRLLLEKTPSQQQPQPSRARNRLVSPPASSARRACRAQPGRCGVRWLCLGGDVASAPFIFLFGGGGAPVSPLLPPRASLRF